MTAGTDRVVFHLILQGIPGREALNPILFIVALGRRISVRLVVIGIATRFSIHAAGAVELKVQCGRLPATRLRASAPRP